MKTSARLLVLLAATAALSGCFRQRNEVIQGDPVGYLQFTGNIEGTVATVTREDGRVVMDQVLVQPRTSYTTKPGTCEVLVVRAGTRVLHRKVFVVDGQTSEVRVPWEAVSSLGSLRAQVAPPIRSPGTATPSTNRSLPIRGRRGSTTSSCSRR